MKYSVSIRRHRTSVSLEPIFWDALGRIAAKENSSREKIITEISDKNESNLSSQVRIYITEYLLEKNNGV